ncbi:MAG: 3-phosphoshikimate 1-carboxyvinyltransferase [Bacteroidetes bacterium]|uniref:3-phosphoshikimate 1-carboxyvinyltransferase n=1 Tax=Phnomibacter sp. TaxID=2836217 RepID=UPI002FDDE36D|nr:3-phosphoshikimate 1-carboxyvinyltransferase [Bacteroidota bacterium]
MVVGIQPGKISGSVTANASKSAMQRACAAALLKKGETIIHNPGNSNDDLAALAIIKAMGAEVTANEADNSLRIMGKGLPFLHQPEQAAIHCGESGLSIRMFTPIAALATQPVTITGEGSLTVRPMHFFQEVLPQLGVQVQTNNGLVPMQVSGPLQPTDITVDGSLSSQFLTGLLMAYAAANASGVSIYVNDLKSKPYIDLTLQVMKQFGLKTPINHQYERFEFTSEEAAAGADNFVVEGDWSGAAFLLVAGAVSNEVLVKGIYNSSRQADKKIIDAILDAGAQVRVEEDQVWVKKDKLEAFEFDATDCPDLFPPLVALAANCTGVTHIKGLRRLKHKESDRGVTLQEEFAKLGVRIDLNDDLMLVHGTGELRVNNFTLNSHHDHRIAMAAAVAAINADFGIQIRNADAVNKSYPDFWKHLAALGISVQNQSTLVK